MCSPWWKCPECLVFTAAWLSISAICLMGMAVLLLAVIRS